MKKNLSLLIIILSILFTACEKEKYGPGKLTGKIHIDVASDINILEIGGKMKTVPLVDDFVVNVYNADGSLALNFARVADMPDTIEISVGSYYIEAFSTNDLPAEFDNPYFFGSSELFEISSNSHTSVNVNCLLSNTAVSVVYSENIINSFDGYSTVVSTDLGSLVFDETEVRMGYFRTSPLDISVNLSYTKPDGSAASRVLSSQVPLPQANRHYQISIDASIAEGMASFVITQDSTEMITEIIEISENTDPDPGGPVPYGDLLITEIMFDPAALSDTEGEYFEIFNNSANSINLQNLMLGRDATNMHTITDSIVLSPGDYYLFCRTVSASDAQNKYVYGSAITLSNTGATLTIYNQEVNESPGEVIFSVNYGDTGFPGGSGVSISLNPSIVDPAEAMLGSSWCNSTSVYNTGDLGTPGTVNDSCQ